MYLRTTKRQNKNGTVVRYYQLAENVWDKSKGCAVAKVVYNFGRQEQVDVAGLRRLARSILRVFGGDDRSESDEEPGTTTPVEVRDSSPYGGVYVLEQLWRELGIDTVLTSLMQDNRIEQPFERALFAMVANRALCPYSKLYCYEQWTREEVYLPSARPLELHHMYLSMDFLEEHKSEIEEAVYFRMADLLNADVDVIFYDTTSLHFEVDEEDTSPLTKDGRVYDPPRKRGHSKNGRGDAPQIVVGLAVTRDGLPVRSWVFSGETSDVTTVAQVKKDLRGWRLGRCIFVGDAGMNSEQNRRTLSLGNGKYILGSRMRAGDEVTKQVITRPGRYRTVSGNLRVKEVTVGDGVRARRYVVCYNPDEETRQRAHRATVIEELDAELTSMRQRTDGKHAKRACHLLTSKRYGKYLRQTKKGNLRLDRKAIKEAARYDGKWVITSNDDTLSAEDLALGYKQLMRVECCWRQLKSGLHMRPVRHFRPWRIHAHVTIAVLALLLERVAEIRAGDTWRNIRARLEQIKVVEYDCADRRIWQTTKVRPEVAELLQFLGVATPDKILSIQTVTQQQAVRRADLAAKS